MSQRFSISRLQRRGGQAEDFTVVSGKGKTEI